MTAVSDSTYPFISMLLDSVIFLPRTIFLSVTARSYIVYKQGLKWRESTVFISASVLICILRLEVVLLITLLTLSINIYDIPVTISLILLRLSKTGIVSCEPCTKSCHISIPNPSK